MHRFDRDITVADLYRRAGIKRREHMPRVGPASSRPQPGPAMVQTTLGHHLQPGPAVASAMGPLPPASSSAADYSMLRTAFEREIQQLRRQQTRELEDHRRQGKKDHGADGCGPT